MFVALAVAAQTVGAQENILSAYRKAVEKRIKESQADVAVAFLTLDGKTEYFFRADDSFHAASTMKIPVMIELFHQVKDRRLRLTDTLTIHNEFHSIVDNSRYELDPNDDSETDLYKAEGESRELGYLCELMITKSSNLATNLLIEKLGVEDIRATVHSLGADGMHVLRGVEDQKAYEQGLNNTITARALQVLLTAIAEGKAVDEDSSRAMIAVLEKQAFNEASRLAFLKERALLIRPAKSGRSITTRRSYMPSARSCLWFSFGGLTTKRKAPPSSPTSPGCSIKRWNRFFARGWPPSDASLGPLPFGNQAGSFPPCHSCC